MGGKARRGEVRASRCRSVRAGDRFVHLGQRFIEREGVRFLDRRKVFEGRRPLRRQRLRAVQNGDVINQPVVVGVGRLISSLIWVGAEIEELRYAKPGERLRPDL